MYFFKRLLDKLSGAFSISTGSLKSIILNILFFSKISKSSSSKLLNLAERKSLFFFIEPMEPSLKLLVFFDLTNTNFGLFSCGLIFNSEFS